MHRRLATSTAKILTNILFEQEGYVRKRREENARICVTFGSEGKVPRECVPVFLRPERGTKVTSEQFRWKEGHKQATTRLVIRRYGNFF